MVMVTAVIEFFTWLITLPVILALTIFSIETLFGLMHFTTSVETRGPTEIVILMPAHNEAAIIASTIAKLEDVLVDTVSLLVVADNCSDATADIVRALGHRVIERRDAELKGKGFALAFGQDFLAQAPPQCVIVLDADCETDNISVSLLASLAITTGKAVQARNILKPDPAASPMVQISSFAFWLKNVVRQRGQQRLGGPALLCGTGMAFPWSLFETLPLATGNIVEDLSLGIHLTKAGKSPIYFDDAVVLSNAAHETAMLVQRTRWEHGFVATARQVAIGAITKGLSTRNRKLFQIGLHLLVPPLALLFALAIAILIVLFAGAYLSGSTVAFIALSLSTAIAGSSVLLAWVVGGHRWLSLRALLRVPVYVIWKIPIFLGLARKAAPEWNRTERGDEGSNI